VLVWDVLGWLLIVALWLGVMFAAVSGEGGRGGFRVLVAVVGLMVSVAMLVLSFGAMLS
jgi:hypothetical protein